MTDIGHRGPIYRLIRGEPSADRIDTEGKQLVKSRIERLEPQDTFAQKVPLECLQVPEVEDDAMPLGNRPLVERISPDDIEKLVRSDASLGQALEKFTLNFDVVRCGKHI